MNCIFCKITNGEVFSEKIYEDEFCFVIPDKFPGSEGQCLVITKEHKDYIFDLEESTYEHIFGVAKKIAKAIDKSFSTKKTGIVVEGLQVGHAHIRLHPIYDGLKINGDEASDEDLKIVSEKIKAKL